MYFVVELCGVGAGAKMKNEIRYYPALIEPGQEFITVKLMRIFFPVEIFQFISSAEFINDKNIIISLLI